MELKDLEEMFKMEQELDIPHRDRWYNKDFDKRELEAEQQAKNCTIPLVSNSLDLRELERKLDEALGKETRETLTEWLKQQRQ